MFMDDISHFTNVNKLTQKSTEVLSALLRLALGACNRATE
jgi:hypothetical protein